MHVMSLSLLPPHPLPGPLVELIAQRFRVLGEPMRIRLLDALRERPLTVGELQEATGGSQQNVSKHLSVLRDAAFVRRTKTGTFARYEIADATVFAICELVCGGLRERLAQLGAALDGGESA